MASGGGLGHRHGGKGSGAEWERAAWAAADTGTGLGETELGKWSGEMPGAEVSAGRPRDSRWPGQGAPAAKKTGA